MSDQIKKLTPLGKAMGKQMIRSWEAPQFQIETEVDCTRLIEYRKRLEFKPSYTTILVKAVAETLIKYPLLNSSWSSDCIITHEDINIGIAVDTKRGLLVPVIKDVANKSVLEIHKAMIRIKEKSQRGNFSIEEMSDATFTLSNLGIFNVTSFKAIVNAPEAGILAVSKIADVPVIRNGQIVPGKVVRLDLSVDHRVADGATGARFITELATVVESLLEGGTLTAAMYTGKEFIMGTYILAIDQSTTTTKAIIFDKKARVVGRCDVSHRQIYPRQGWVEHDPEEIYRNIVSAVRLVLDNTGISTGDVVALSVTNQRETTMMWTPDGKPVYNAIVWQCPRAEYIVRRSEIDSEKEYITYASGLQLSPYFSAAKAAWIKENSGASGELMFGTMDSWVIWKLTGRHITDYSNASRTQLFNIHELCWDKKVLKLFGLQDVIMPEVCNADEVFGTTTVDGLFKKAIPVAGDMGDSHGALFAQNCWDKGMGKCTFGTGGSIMMNIGTTPMISKNKISTSIAWGLSGNVEYVFEGTIICMGDTIKWLINEAGLIKNSAESEEYAEKVDSSGGVYLVPAFVGLGAPYWQSEVRAMICGLHRNANKYHIVRAGVESFAYQIRDIVDPMVKDARITLKELRVDGGPTNNKFLMQITADILNTSIVKNSVEELSALGAAYAGGLAVGFWKDREEIAALRRTSASYKREMPDDKAEKLYKGWQDYVALLIAGS